MQNLLDGIIWLTKVDDKVPIPLLDSGDLNHAVEEDLEQRRASPDGGQAVTRHPDVAVLLLQLQYFSVQVLLPLSGKVLQ